MFNGNIVLSYGACSLKPLRGVSFTWSWQGCSFGHDTDVNHFRELSSKIKYVLIGLLLVQCEIGQYYLLEKREDILKVYDFLIFYRAHLSQNNQ